MKQIGKVQSGYLHMTRVIFKNIGKDPQIAAALDAHSFSESRIQEGLVLHGAAEQAYRVLLERRQDRFAAAGDMREKLKEFNLVYAGHLGRLRKELVDAPAVREKLALAGKRQRAIARFIEQANLFYTTAVNNAVVAAAILPFGFTPEAMQAALDMLGEYQTLRSEYQRLAGECQKLLVDREKAFKALRRWMSALAAACRVAFADNLQTMEEIGFFVRNRNKPKNGTGEPPTEPEPPVEPPVDPGTGGTGTDPVDPGTNP